MYNTKLIKVLTALDEGEAQKLGYFVASPAFNTGKRPIKVQRLLEYVLSYHPVFDSPLLEKSQVYRHVFPDELYRQNKLDKLASEAMNIVQDFIAIFCTDVLSDSQKSLAMVRYYQDRNIEKELPNAIHQTRQILDGMPFKEHNYFLQRYRLEYEQLKHLLKQYDKKDDVNFHNTIEALDLFYFMSKMELCSSLYALQLSTKIDIQLSLTLVPEMMDYVKNHHLNIPLASAYYHTYNLLLNFYNNGDEHYQLLKNKLKLFEGQISISELRPIHNHMRVYLTHRYNHGNPNSLQELFELFKAQIGQKTLYQDGVHIWSSTLQNAVTVALKLNETDWALQFLSSHKDRIKGPDDDKGIYQFNLANIHFHKGEFTEASACLEQSHFRELFYNLAARRLAIKLDYETKLPIEVFEYRLKALKSFVHGQKKLLQTDKFESNNNFVNMLLQLFNLIKDNQFQTFKKTKIGSVDSSQVDVLLEKVQTTQFMAEREWLVEKLELLK